MNTEKLKMLARDLRTTPPRSPRETLGGFVIAARMLDKARATILGTHGEYNYFPCGLGAYFWKFTGLDAAKFKDFVATGATDQEVDRWIRENATQKDRKAIIRWNNEISVCASAICLSRCRNILKLTSPNSVVLRAR